MENDVSLEQKVMWYEEAVDNTSDARALSEKCRDYYDNKQWTEEEKIAIESRGQAAITINRIQPKVDFLLGMERHQRTDPKAYPRNPKFDENSANAATDSIRYVCDNEDFDPKRSDVFENQLVEGTGGAFVGAKKGKRGIEIEVKYLDWDRVFYDPHSRRKDFSDAKYMGIVTWMDLSDAKLKWGEKAEELEATLSDTATDDTFEDAPRTMWADRSRKRVRVIEMYYENGGVWYRCVFSKFAELENTTKSPYIDEDGDPENPIILQSPKVDREGNRYGFVRTLLDPQDEINKRRSKALHLLSVRQTKGERGAVDNVAEMKRELSKPDGHVEYTKGFEFDVISTGDMAAAQFSLLQEAKQEIDSVGANAAMQGKEERNMSGRALESRQQSGQIELGPFFDNLRTWQKRVYRAVWNRIKQFWKEEKWVRVTDDEKNMKWVGLNRPVKISDRVLQQFGQIPREMQGDPELDKVLMVENNVGELDVDIILEDVPDIVSLQSEQFDMLVSMFDKNPNGMPWDLIIEMSQLRNKDAILERLRGGDEQAQKAKMQQDQEAQQLAKADAMAEVDKKKAVAEKDRSQAMKNMSEVERGFAPPVQPGGMMQ